MYLQFMIWVRHGSLWYGNDFFILMQIKLIFSEGILHAHACFCWTTIAWAHQMWWREIENSREVIVIWRAISLVLWIQYFPTKTVLHINDKQTDVFYAGFSCRFSSGRFSWPFLKRLNAKKSLFLYKSDFHWQSNAFLWLLWFDFQTHGFTYQVGNAL